MAEETSSRTASEPWPGYGKLSADERHAELDKLFADAKEHRDKSYALLLTSAVANYEMVHELQPGETHAEPVAVKARDLHRDAGSWIGS
jgi:hypothetical protein